MRVAWRSFSGRCIDCSYHSRRDPTWHSRCCRCSFLADDSWKATKGGTGNSHEKQYYGPRDSSLASRLWMVSGGAQAGLTIRKGNPYHSLNSFKWPLRLIEALLCASCDRLFFSKQPLLPFLNRLRQSGPLFWTSEATDQRCICTRYPRSLQC